MELKLNSLNLNTGWYKTEGIQFDSSPPIEFTDLSFASEDGAKFVTSKYTPKTLTITGRITHNTVAGLEAEMDNFKKILLSTPNINLNFSYANSYRQYVGNVQNLTLTRKHFNITYVPFEITFVAEDPPFAYDISTIDQVIPNLSEVFSSDAIVGNTYSHTLTMSGTAPPLARWTYLLDAVSGRIEQLVFKSIKTGKQMELNAAFSAGDEIVIDEESLSVTNNAQPIEYEGVFPAFKVGANELQLGVIGSNFVSSSGLLIDQSQTAFSRSYSIPAGWQIGNSFTAGVTKTFKRISVLLYFTQYYTTGQNIYLSVWTTSGGFGVPVTLLETSTLFCDASFKGTTQWLDFSISQSFTAGTIYAYTVTSDDPVKIIFMGTRNVYYGGNEIVKSPTSSWAGDGDMSFKTYYQQTPTSNVYNYTASLKIEQKKRFL